MLNDKEQLALKKDLDRIPQFPDKFIVSRSQNRKGRKIAEIDNDTLSTMLRIIYNLKKNLN